MENYLRNHPDERLSRIQELGKALVGAGTLGAEVRRDVADITARWNLLSQQANERAHMLEGSAQQASVSEGRLQVSSLSDTCVPCGALTYHEFGDYSLNY